MEEPLPEDMALWLERTAERRGAFGARLHYFPEIGSSNDYAAALAEAGAAEGTAVVAAAQTAGRGRFGRSWFSPPGAGLYVSVIVRDRRAAPLLTLAAGVAIADGIRTATGLVVEIKWPNDIVVPAGLRRWRKVAGILAEGALSADGVQYVVLGFGINIKPAAYPSGIVGRATSLETELGRDVDTGALLAECLAELAANVRQLVSAREEDVLARWRALAPTSAGSPVEWDDEGTPRRGHTAGIDATGALLVHHGAGTRRIVSGTLRWM